MRISVIMATTCEERRARELGRAVESVLGQTAVDVELLVIVNGTRFHEPRRDALDADPRLRVHYQEAGSYPAALKLGRQLVSSPYFTCLDDDDYFLEGALQARLAAIEAGDGIDFVVTNGYREIGGQAQVVVRDSTGIRADPLGAALRANWFPSSSGLFRSETIGTAFFDGTTRHFEWTWLLYQLLLAGKRVQFLDAPTFHISDTPDSLSKAASVECIETELWMLHQILPQLSSPLHRAFARTKQRQAYHSLAERHLRSGQMGGAWQAHLRSVACPGGWRHLAFTRHLISGRTLSVTSSARD